MKTCKAFPIAILALAFTVLTGCQASGERYAASVYDTAQVNQKQEAKTVQIISVMPAKVAVDNTENKKNAQTFGTILGAVAGGVAGYSAGSGSSSKGALAGAVGGGALGAAAGTLVDDKTLVEGVTLSYSEDNKVYTSTQVGKQCEFQPGLALVVTTQANETRIQPNATCPTKS